MGSYSPDPRLRAGARVEEHLPDAPCHPATPLTARPAAERVTPPHGHLWCRSIRLALIGLQERLPEIESHEAVIEHVDSEAKLYRGHAWRRRHPDSSSDAPSPLTPGRAAAVDENPAEPCSCLLCQMRSDQHRDWAWALLHIRSND
jgi:hypothetical protein